jgi:hypothetical protein
MGTLTVCHQDTLGTRPVVSVVKNAPAAEFHFGLGNGKYEVSGLQS